MAADSSFDVVSKVDRQEVKNAVQQTAKEISQRFDLKGSASQVEFNEKEGTITLIADHELQLGNVSDILNGKLAKRNVPLRMIEYGPVEPAPGGTVRQVGRIKEGIDPEKGKAISKAIRDAKFKVNAQLQGDQIRISSKSKDELQAVIRFLKEHDFGIELQFSNYR